MPKTLIEIGQALAAAKAEGAKLIDDFENGKIDQSAYDTAYEGVEAKVEALEAEKAAAEKLAEQRRRMASSTALTPALDLGTDEPDRRATGGFDNIGEFAVAVRAACRPASPVVDQRLSSLAAAPGAPHQGGGAEGEGFLLPPQFRDEIWQLMLGEDSWLQRTDLEPTMQREVKMPVDESTPWGTGGIRAYWRDEGDAMTATRQRVDKRSVPVDEVYVLIEATEELLEDSPRLSSWLTEKAAERLSWTIDDAIHFGDGVGKPLGWFNAPATVTVAKESGQSAATIVVRNLSKMESRLLRVPGDTPIWMANSEIIPQLRELTVGDVPVFLPPGGISGAQYGTLFGYQIIFTEHAKALGAKGDISLLSMRGYQSFRRTAGPQFASSMHLYFDYNTMAFRWIFRVGGQPKLSAPVARNNGSSTKSHFVTLGART